MAGQDILYGVHVVQRLLRQRPEIVNKLIVADGSDRRLSDLLEQAAAAGVRVERMPRAGLDSAYPEINHQGVVAVVQPAELALQEKQLPDFLDRLDEAPFLLVLDGVQDPHNLGACMRSADAAGVHAVIAPRDRATGLTPVVHKVACGATLAVPLFQVTNLARTLRLLKERGIWLYGASDSAGQSLYATDLDGPLALVLGSEGSGLRRLTAELCDFQLAIPMAGVVESLNVSVATGVLLYEAVRQRNFHK